jgi:hypothetical protein
MSTVSLQIRSADEVISRNIASLAEQRGLLSQNVLSQLRNLVEGVVVYLHKSSLDAVFKYESIAPALVFIGGNAKYNFLGKFHKLIQNSASHYTLDGDSSERLMLKYYEYLHRIRTLLLDECSLAVLTNLEDFPLDIDSSLQEYYEKIASKIETHRSIRSKEEDLDRYYIHKTRPFFVGGRIYYEVTFYRAINKVSKFDRIIAFTHIDISDNYASTLSLYQDFITVIGQTMPITIIREWEVSIRPCEFDNFARCLGMPLKTRANSPEYRYLMRYLTTNSASLLDLLDQPDEKFFMMSETGTENTTKRIRGYKVPCRKPENGRAVDPNLG